MKIYTPEQEARYVEVLKEIQRNIPKGMIDGAISQKKLTPTVERVMDAALDSAEISEEKKAQIRNLKELGTFSKEAVLEDAKMVKALDEYVNRQINKAIKEGRLPPRSHVKYLPSIMKIKNETKN